MDNLGEAYKYLLARARDQKQFSTEEFGRAVKGWTGKTASTYISKQLKSIVIRVATGRYIVTRHFIHLSEEDFQERVSQKESILPSYNRIHCANVVNYEFLMPLTREALLRAALDNLFFKNTLEEQIRLVGPERFVSVLPKRENESDEKYSARVAQVVSKYFGGYSITHVNGRFRAGGLIDQTQAVGKRYIVDETTALVRFIIPLKVGEKTHGDLFTLNASTGPVFSSTSAPGSDPIDKEIVLIRTLFLNVFGEVVVHSVQGEDEIWLLETFRGCQQLFKWEVQS